MAATLPSVSAITSPHHRTPIKGQQNVENVVLGNLRMHPQYASFYPEELIGGRRTPLLYVCQWCFRYTNELMKYAAHCNMCGMKDGAGLEGMGRMVYEKDGYAIYEVDGEEHKLYAQNLSLFAKLFLDTKSVFFDVNSFLYYILVQKTNPDPSTPSTTPNGTSSSGGGGQVIGFFSKEKMSWDNNNLACILIFPPWQRRGLGQLLIASSYVLGRREGRFGGPEKPLSTPGRKGYMAYWSSEICRFVLKSAGKKTVSVKTISEATWIGAEDLVAALREMGVCEGRKTAGGSLVVNKSKVRAWAERHGVGLEAVVDVDAFDEEEEVEGSEESSGDE